MTANDNVVEFPERKGWSVIVAALPVVVPVNDRQPHDVNSVWCQCKPSMKWENGPLLVHNAFDGRK